MGQLGICARLRNLRTQAVQSHQLQQHLQKARLEQITALGKDGVEVGTSPFQSVCAISSLNGKAHVRDAGVNTQLRKQRDQIGISALVVNEEAGVDAVSAIAMLGGQGDVHGMRMSAKIAASLKKCDLRAAFQGVRCAQTRNAGANDGNFSRLCHHANPDTLRGNKNAERRPKTK